MEYKEIPKETKEVKAFQIPKDFNLTRFVKWFKKHQGQAVVAINITLNGWQPGSREAYTGQWVIIHDDRGFTVLTDEQFKKTYVNSTRPHPYPNDETSLED